MRWALMLVLTGCHGITPPTDRERLTAIMGRNDDHKLKIQLRTHAPDEEINRRLAEIEAGLRELASLRPFGDRRDDILATMTARSIPVAEELNAARWTAETVERNWRKLEVLCSGCHAAIEAR